jgi:hypothetical protein
LGDSQPSRRAPVAAPPARRVAVAWPIKDKGGLRINNMTADINAKAEVKVISANHVLIASVHFLTFGDDLTDNDLFLTYEGETLAIPVKFMDVPDKEPFMAINDEYASKGIIGLTFINFSNSVGVWNRTAYNIGEIAGQRIYLRAKILSSPGLLKHHEVLLSFYTEQSK